MPSNSTAATPPASPTLFEVLPARFLSGLAVLAALFSIAFFQLGKLALSEDLHSHTILIPFVSAYLIYVRWNSLPKPGSPHFGLGALFGATGIGLAAFGITSLSKGAVEDYLAVMMLAFTLLVAATSALTIGAKATKAIAFPIAFLGFLMPLPLFVQHYTEIVLQHGSAEAAYWMFRLAGTTIFREGLIFQLSTITLEVAPQCSGIRSSYVLLITSAVAANLFLDSNWKRAALVCFVLPLALFRNGLRVFTLGELCVNIGPHMIDSFIHHSGGPIFFAISLGPFFAFLYILWRSENRKKPTPT